MYPPPHSVFSTASASVLPHHTSYSRPSLFRVCLAPRETTCFCAWQDVLVVLRDIQGSINSLGSSGGARLTNSSAGGSAGPRAIPARASAVGKLK